MRTFNIVQQVYFVQLLALKSTQTWIYMALFLCFINIVSININVTFLVQIHLITWHCGFLNHIIRHIFA